MAKLNLRTARRIKTASGEVLRLKGQGFEWANLTMRVKDAFGPDLQGIWDFRDARSLYQDAAGTLPATEFDDPIGLALDKGPHGHHLSQATTPARPRYTPDGALHDGVDDFLQAANAEDWTFLHDGSGGVFGVGYKDTPPISLQGLAGTMQSTNSLGVRVEFGPQAGGIIYARNASGGTSVTTSYRQVGLPGVMNSLIVTRSGLTLQMVDGIGRTYENLDAPAVPLPPTSPLRSVSIPAGAALTAHRMFAISRVPTESERALLNAWLMEGVL